MALFERTVFSVLSMKAASSAVRGLRICSLELVEGGDRLVPFLVLIRLAQLVPLHIGRRVELAIDLPAGDAAGHQHQASHPQDRPAEESSTAPARLGCRGAARR